MSVGGSSGSETQGERAELQDQVDPDEIGGDKTWMDGDWPDMALQLLVPSLRLPAFDLQTSS